MTRVLLAGDHFVTSDLLRKALNTAGDIESLDLREIELDWPVLPFGRVDDVDEASGNPSELIAALEGVEVLITQMGAVTEEVIRASPDLRLIVVCRGGPVNVNLPVAAEHGISVCTTPGRNATAAAEHTVALMLAAMRQIPALHNSVIGGEWRSDLYSLHEVGMELDGSTVGLVGLGEIGKRVAHILTAFGSRVRAYDPYSTDPSVELVSLQDLITQSDIISLHARATPETNGIIGSEQISAMRQGAVLVNTARGALLDYDAVASGLINGHLGAAAFDVFEEEPIPSGSKILSAPRTVLTPHLAGATRQTAERAATMAAQAVNAYLTDSELPWVQQ